MKDKEKKKQVSNLMRSVSRRVGMAVADYKMLADKDKIIVAVSGGKDSLSLLSLLKYRQTFIPIDIELLAVHIDMGIPSFPTAKVIKYLKKQRIPFLVEKIDILKNKGMDNLNCFWCSWNRRKALFQLAGRLGFNKIAFGHHLDDIIETILINLFYRGEIGAMKPCQELFKGKVTIIRPLAYVEEDEIIKLAKELKISKIDNYKCPRSETSKRTMLKKLIASLKKENPAIKKNIFKSLERIREEYLLDK